MRQLLKVGTVAGAAHIDPTGRVLFTADAHRSEGKRFIVTADEKLTTFLELENALSKEAER